MKKALLAAAAVFGIGGATALSATARAAQPYPDPLFFLAGVPQTIDTYVSAALTGTVSGTVAGMKCDGSTDDTVALQTAFSAALAFPWAHRIALPNGTCNFSAPVYELISKNLSITGSAATTLNFTGPGTSTAAGVGPAVGQDDGLILQLSAGANLVMREVAITKGATANASAAKWGGRGLYIGSADNNSGSVLLDTVSVSGNWQGEGWNTPLEIQAWHSGELRNVKAANTAAGDVAAGDAVYPGSTATTWGTGTMAPGHVTAIYAHGVAGGQYITSVSMADVQAIGGNVGIELKDFQDVKITNSHILDGDYGVIEEAPDASMINEDFSLTNSLVNAYYNDVFLNGTTDNNVTSNTLWGFAGAGSLSATLGWTGVTLFGSAVDKSTVGPNAIMDGPGHAPISVGVYSCTSTFPPHTIVGNSIEWVTTGIQTCVGDWAVGSGNDFAQTTNYIVNGGQANFMGDGFSGVTEDGAGGLKVAQTIAAANVSSPLQTSAGNSASYFKLHKTTGQYTGTAGTLALGNFPASAAGQDTLRGELTCSTPGGGLLASWKVLGHYNWPAGASAMKAQGLSMTPETDSDTAFASSLTGSGGPSFALSSSTIGLVVTVPAAAAPINCVLDADDTHEQ